MVGRVEIYCKSEGMCIIIVILGLVSFGHVELLFSLKMHITSKLSLNYDFIFLPIPVGNSQQITTPIL